MTAPLYKQQAARLAEHFSSVHKMRLKHASALEAVAALHGLKDWNTLLAAPAATPSPVPAPRLTHDSALNYLFPDKSFVDPQFCDALLSVQSLLSGNAEAEREVLADQLLAQQVKRGGFLYLECGDGKKLDNLAWAVAQAGKSATFHVVDWHAPELSGTYNPFVGMTPEEVANTVMTLMPASDNSPGTDFYRSTAYHALQVIAMAKLELREPLTFLSLAQILAQPEIALLPMEHRLPAESFARISLKVLLDSYRKNKVDGPGLDGARLQSNLGGLAGRVAQMTTGRLGEIFNSDTGSVSLQDAVAQGLGVYMRGGPVSCRTSRALTRIAMASLESALARAFRTDHPPFTVFVSGAAACDLWSKRLTALARQAGVGVVFIDPNATSDTRFMWDTTVSVAAAVGFGSNATVTLHHSPTSSQQKAILRDVMPWPVSVSPYRKPR